VCVRDSEGVVRNLCECSQLKCQSHVVWRGILIDLDHTKKPSLDLLYAQRNL
jgi:hypothetical protein